MDTDTEKLVELSLRVWGYKQGEVVALMIHLGDQLGLYRAMAGAGPLSAAGLAAATGLDQRWLLEWLRCMGAAGLLETDDGDTFALSPEGAAVLADESGSVWFAAGVFGGLVATPDIISRLLDAFRTGRGLSYDELGPSAAHGVDRMTRPWTTHLLVPQILPSLEGLLDRLTGGATVADVGCGAGIALEAMAAAFPASQFHGWDPSSHALTLARERMVQRGLTNVTLHQAGAAALPAEETYDFVLTLDCLHDMPKPTEAIAAIARCLRPDGVWLIKDIRSASTWSGNLRNPMLALMYGTSVTTCMSSALSEPGGAGLGTLGLPPSLLEQMCREAGFSQFAVRDFGEPANLYYEVRP
ncbi:MAG TPA: class I SAM-dependent methyltransferase [Acidimicrobiales bacterium]|jgi:2-polyprenyl-3-methyl-5-hydroxy-6-metoxy-1,4-benzoquinol methylase